MSEVSDQILQRRKKLEELRAAGINPYVNKFTISHSVSQIVQSYGNLSGSELESIPEIITAGRIMSLRIHGKNTFAHIRSGEAQIQIYVRTDRIGPEAYERFTTFDIGDFIGVRGTLFRTKTGELTSLVSEVKLLSKSLRPLPEKWHGLRDVELRYRQRYVDLIANPEVREIFKKRTATIQALRTFLNERGFLEVETPMMHPIAGGAAARPFVTHHNALNMDLYLRIAPELYLKRLVVGGFERVYEINRNFRNEGISTEHNPEFTMLEFYMAYADYRDLMKFSEEMLNYVAEKVLGSNQLVYQGQSINLTPPWTVLPLKEAIVQHDDGISIQDLENEEKIKEIAQKLGIPTTKMTPAKLLLKIFDVVVQPRLIQPTFIIDFPIEVSPLSKAKEDNPEVAERFELFIAGKEVANAFTELNDPIDQRERFERQVREREAGDEEAHRMDEDYLRALEYGMPPTAGEGVGVDRLVMLLTNSSSIREVILFPLLKQET